MTPAPDPHAPAILSPPPGKARPPAPFPDPNAPPAAVHAVEFTHHRRGGDNALVLVVRDSEGEAIGIGTLVLHRVWGELVAFWVHPGARGRGIADALLAQAEAHAAAEGAIWLRLETGIDNHPARAFYRRHGYTTPAGRLGDPLRIVLEKYLGPPVTVQAGWPASDAAASQPAHCAGGRPWLQF